jgi:hypothetical protein
MQSGAGHSGSVRNPSYSGGADQEYSSLRETHTKELRRPNLNKQVGLHGTLFMILAMWEA